MNKVGEKMSENVNPEMTSEVATTAPPASRSRVIRDDVSLNAPYRVHQAYNDFILRLEALKANHPEWDNPRNQNRPFKLSFLKFLHNLVLRLPVAPEMTPKADGTVRLRYKKMHSPRDKWQCFDITIHPQRHFTSVATSRLADVQEFPRMNKARPDYLSELIQEFYEHDNVSIKEHPLRFRRATTLDYPYISALCQSTFGPFAKYSPAKIKEICSYCYVADDPRYGIVSVAAIGEHPDSPDLLNPQTYEISFLVTLQNYRGLGIIDRCIRKALTDLAKDHEDAIVLAACPMKDGETNATAHSALHRCGFKKVSIVRGEKRYRDFECDRCNVQNCWCDFQSAASVCSTVHYQMTDCRGKLGLTKTSR